jgi:hypothetical protein
MKKIANILISASVLTLAPVRLALASFDMEKAYTTSGIANIVLLVCAFICLVWSLKVLSLVRGGLMSKSWQMFVLGFGFLVIAQILAIGEKVELYYLPGYTLTVFYLLMAITWLIGLYRTRKVLG